MKALTICQPYAELIVRGEKRVENRTWLTNYRGEMYIHAGKSRAWFDDDAHLIQMLGCKPPFGALIGIATLVDCVQYSSIVMGDYNEKYPWLYDHEHANGPWCWILENVKPMMPVPYRGAQGLFNVDDVAIHS
jgi:hypothetical protein